MKGADISHHARVRRVGSALIDGGFSQLVVSAYDHEAVSERVGEELDRHQDGVELLQVDTVRRPRGQRVVLREHGATLGEGEADVAPSDEDAHTSVEIGVSEEACGAPAPPIDDAAEAIHAHEVGAPPREVSVETGIEGHHRRQSRADAPPKGTLEHGQHAVHVGAAAINHLGHVVEQAQQRL